ncbi:hypothetical protein JQM68_11930 [Oscillibacter valericigenes]|uniref:hypothetical protein n=1 Tax=Oscillibacter valericigenes TaxID=351091 RepID=UPI001F31E309|nr:hypothetical protein [Oscillibacter valericigenes]MCF2617896.1 hypothetical protein [Oscillibacter valericigenes]
MMRLNREGLQKPPHGLLFCGATGCSDLSFGCLARCRTTPPDSVAKITPGSGIMGIHTMLHEAMKAAEESHIIAKNPTENIPVPKANPKPKQVLNDDQLERFMEAIKHDAVWHDFFCTELTACGGVSSADSCGAQKTGHRKHPPEKRWPLGGPVPHWLRRKRASQN